MDEVAKVRRKTSLSYRVRLNEIKSARHVQEASKAPIFWRASRFRCYGSELCGSRWIAQNSRASTTAPASTVEALLKRTSYDDYLRRSNRRKTYSDGREEVDVMWAGLRLVESQFAEAGFAPR
jgi:hypothetical protein